MNHRKSAMGRSRDLGTGSNGKGSADRVSDTAAYAANYDAINWGRRDEVVDRLDLQGEVIINPAWVNAPISIDEIVPPYACLDTGPEPALEDFEIWDR